MLTFIATSLTVALAGAIIARDKARKKLQAQRLQRLPRRPR
ncbi:hypothetical protein [Noviherbaspirillum galbum]|nr:hypothetical protein [Noviherbaspirillum galbum]